jgi:O-antigen/teichoic acid export membrane protein
MTTRVMAAVPARLRDRWSPGARSLLRKGVWALADQGLISATNFVMTVLVARALSPRDFGLYALMFTALLFLNNVQSALVSQPHTMRGAPLSGQEFVGFTTTTAWTQVMLSCVGAFVIALIGSVGLWRGWGAAPLLFACASATAAWQMQEFVRRILYIRSKVSAAFLNDVVSYFGQLLLVLLLWRTERLTTVSATVAIAVTSLLGAILGAWQVRAYLGGRPAWTAFRTTATSNWNFGKWLLGGHIATWMSGRLYPILAAGMISVATTGAMKAVQTILGPMNVLVFALDPLLGPMAARRHAAGGVPALRAYIGKIQWFMLLTVGLYCLLVSIFARPILDLVYADQYTDYAWLLVVMAINYTFIALRGPMALALTVLGETSSVFRIHLLSCVVNLTLGIAVVYVFRLPCIGIGILINGIVLQAITWHVYLRHTGGTSPFDRFIRSSTAAGNVPPFPATLAPSTTLRPEEVTK